MKNLILITLFYSSVIYSAPKELSDNDVIKMIDKKCNESMTFKPDVTRIDCPRILHICKDVTFETCSQNNSLKVKNNKTRKFYDYNLLEKPTSKLVHDKLIEKELKSNQAKKEISGLDKSDESEKDRHDQVVKVIKANCDSKMTVQNIKTSTGIDGINKQFHCKNIIFEVRPVAPTIRMNVFDAKKKIWIIPKEKEIDLKVPPFVVMDTLMGSFQKSNQYKELSNKKKGK